MLGRSLLHLALDLDVDVTKKAAIRLSDRSIAAKDVLGRSLLHLACSKGRMSLVSFLVERKADLGDADCHGRQALHYASASGEEDVAELLLGYGAEVEWTDYHGCTPLELATKNGKSAMISLLRRGAVESTEELCRATLQDRGTILEWPCVSHMLQDLLRREGINDPTEFPIRREEQRCSLRNVGRLDGRDAADRTQDPRSLQDAIYGPEAVGFPESGPQIPGSSLGYNGAFPSEPIAERCPPGPLVPGVEQGTSCSYALAVEESGVPGFGEHEVWMYVESFEEHIHIIHPIILPKTLHDMIRTFLNGMQRPSAGFSATSGLDRGRPTATAHSAAVLAILALGKLCLHRSPFADALLESDALPGWGYLAMARNIIGTQLSGNTLEHAYAELFFGMYYGQVGRVVESHTYISQGCTTLMNFLRPYVIERSRGRSPLCIYLPVLMAGVLDALYDSRHRRRMGWTLGIPVWCSLSGRRYGWKGAWTHNLPGYLSFFPSKLGPSRLLLVS